MSIKPCKNIRSSIVIYIFLILVLIIVAAPLLWALSASFTPNSMVYDNVSPFTIEAFIPIDFTLDAYRVLFTERNFGIVVLRTLAVSLISVFLGIVIAFTAGFAFARFNFCGKKFLFSLVMISFMVPIEVTVLPLYIMMVNAGWINTWQGLIIPGIANGLVIFLFRQFFYEIPESMLEAAKIDGTPWLRILRSVVLPVSWPVTIGAGLILFLAAWNNYFWPLLVATKPLFRLVQVAISMAIQEQQTFWNELFAGSLIAAIVPVIIVLPLQKYYVESVATSGIKG